MKTDKKINPQSTTRNEDINQSKPSVTTGTSHLNQETTKNPQTPQTPKTPQKEEKETWKHPDPTSPEKRQDVYADKKDLTSNKQQDEDYESGEINDEDVDTTPQARITNNPGRNEDQTEDNINDQIRP
jgi:hypothetical protein